MNTRCTACGRFKPKDRRACCSIECAIRRSIDNAQQLRAHSGPAWDAWRDAMERKGIPRIATGIAMSERRL